MPKPIYNRPLNKSRRSGESIIQRQRDLLGAQKISRQQIEIYQPVKETDQQFEYVDTSYLQAIPDGKGIVLADIQVEPNFIEREVFKYQTVTVSGTGEYLFNAWFDFYLLEVKVGELPAAIVNNPANNLIDSTTKPYVDLFPAQDSSPYPKAYFAKMFANTGVWTSRVISSNKIKVKCDRIKYIIRDQAVTAPGDTYNLKMYLGVLSLNPNLS